MPHTRGHKEGRGKRDRERGLFENVSNVTGYAYVYKLLHLGCLGPNNCVYTLEVEVELKVCPL